MYLFPNVNMQDLNLDWILNQIKEMAASISDQAGKNAQALALTVEQSTLMKGFLGYFPAGTFSWTEDENGIITSITVLKQINDVIIPVCNAWLNDQGIQGVIDEARTQADRASAAAEEAIAASSNYNSVYSALMNALSMLNYINSTFNADYVFQYLDQTTMITGAAYFYNGETHTIEKNTTGTTNYRIYPVIYNIPRGVYTYTALRYSVNATSNGKGSTYIQYVHDGTVLELSNWGNKYSNTIFIPYDFNLYATTDNTVDNQTKSFITSIKTPETVTYGMYKYGVSDLDDIMYDFTMRKQYLDITTYNFNNERWGINNSQWLTRIAAANTNAYLLPPVYNLKPGLYTFRGIFCSYSVIYHLSTRTFESITSILRVQTGNPSLNPSIGTQYSITINDDFYLFPTSRNDYILGTNGVTAYFINGDGTQLPAPFKVGVYRSSFTEIREAVSTVTGLAAQIDTAPLFMQKTCYTVGHMGNQILAPRNTAPGYIIARRMGCMAGENDLNQTSDGTYVMYHGTDLRYANKHDTSNLVTLTGKDIYISDGTYYYKNGDNYYTLVGDTLTELEEPTLVNGLNVSLASTTYEIISKISFGACYSDDYTNIGILTFPEYVLLSKKLGLGINLDYKISSNGWTDEQISDIVSTLRAYGMLRVVRWGSIGRYKRDYLRSKDPEAVISVGIYAETSPGVEETNDEFAARAETWVSYNTDHNVVFSAEGKYEDGEVVINTDKIGIAHSKGFDVSGYIIQTGMSEAQYAAVMNGLVEAGVISITCDNHTVSDLYEDLRNSYL